MTPVSSLASLTAWDGVLNIGDVVAVIINEQNNNPLDTTAPTLVITLNDTNLTSGDTATVTFAFSESVSGFSTTDISLTDTRGTISNLVAVDNKTYRATFSPITNSESAANTISVAQGSYTDIAGNAGVAVRSSNFVIDTKTPTLTITLSTSTLTAGQTATVTFTFSENVSGFTQPDISLADANGSLSGFVAINGAIYQAIFTPFNNLSDTTNTLSVANGAYNDVLGNAGQSATSASYSINTVAVPPPSGGQTFYGTAGSETIRGTAYNDIIYGVPITGVSPGRDSVDTLIGGTGADIFMLGDIRGYFYDDGNARNTGKGDYAILSDFVSGEDKIGIGASYFTSAATINGTKGLGIYGDTNRNARYDPTSDELIGFVPNYSFLPATDFIIIV